MVWKSKIDHQRISIKLYIQENDVVNFFKSYKGGTNLFDSEPASMILLRSATCTTDMAVVAVS